MVQIIFGDDEHTAKDGPYARIIKTRKWLYIIAVALIIVTKGLYDPIAAKAILKVVALPVVFLSTSLSIALIYLIIQYSMIMWQLFATYDIILDERFTFRRADDLAKAVDQESAAQAHLEIARGAVSTPEINRLRNLLAGQEASASSERQMMMHRTEKLTYLEGSGLPREMIEQEKNSVILCNAEWERLEAAARNTRDDILRLSDIVVDEDDPAFSAALSSFERAQRERKRLAGQVPSSRLGYFTTEIIIDIGRIFPPIFLGLYALWIRLA